MKTSIWWIRRDLRLADNQALQAAMEAGEQVLPLFILDPSLLESNREAGKRLAFLYDGLRALDKDLHARGSRLILRHGNPQGVLTNLVEEVAAGNIFAEEDFSPYAIRRDERITASMPLTLTPGLTIHHPAAVLKADGEPYTVFTPFSRTWKARPLPKAEDFLPVPERIHTPGEPASEAIPTIPELSDEIPFRAGEAHAVQRLKAFVEGKNAPIMAYSEARNRMDIHGTSQLSPYLRFGMLSTRQVVLAASDAIKHAETKQAKAGAETWLSELIWREFYIVILYHFPHVLERNFRTTYDNLAWDHDLQAFSAWCDGRTGYPIVDAAMRQLRTIGWMHNRARMVTASFLVKNLLVDWRWGERWFKQHLIDGDPAANNGGWQWVAGTGTDAAPYFRIFNPVLQGKKFDPNGDYIHRWVPELISLAKNAIHEPWQLSGAERKAIEGRYPEPIVDLRMSRERALEAYAAAREE